VVYILLALIKTKDSNRLWAQERRIHKISSCYRFHIDFAMAIAAEDGASLRIDKFMGENFHLWKFKMQMVLEERELWGIVSGGEVEPTGDGIVQATIQKFRKRARKAFATICFSLGDEQLSLVRSAKTAKEAWDKLENHYKVKSLANKLFLRRKHVTATMAESDAMLEHINRLVVVSCALLAVHFRR